MIFSGCQRIPTPSEEFQLPGARQAQPAQLAELQPGLPQQAASPAFSPFVRVSHPIPFLHSSCLSSHIAREQP